MMDLKELVTAYVLYTVHATKPLNDYVPNSHIGKRFCEVLEFIGYYESDEHLNVFASYNFEAIVREVFCDSVLNDLNVHAAYQRLRERENALRNLMKLLMIEHDELMAKRVERGMFDIYKEIYAT